ncbi:hypothetical protein B0A52_05617 [Exophiala mesophila]|uniref:Protein kinase domain-containing protein n=1 Tax=Exophiala mesophila TaxID=212818 RepID=A0A0D1WTN9_EXOME|nr:uncharacterized protein PV10_03854 [Exophiala mesophila]KIV92570.1 hypothetical protein PV10_03854 [Exophiala mesophila]RVX70284.1 hypothetical protein B0A52_05617 [Exophiala mesophila]
MSWDIAEYVYLDGSAVNEHIIAVGGTGVVVRRGSHAVKIPRISRLIESEGVALTSGTLTPPEGAYDERAAMTKVFQKEKAILRRLGNYNGIIQCYNILSDDCSIEMPLMEGNLRQLLGECRPTQKLILSWLQELANTIAYIHSKRVIIADIRLDNIVYDSHKTIRLIDFSESTLMPLDWDLEGHDDAGFSTYTDIGQFGATMFEMITSQRCAFDIYQEWKEVGDSTIWPRRDTLPETGGVWLGPIIERCWTKGFASAKDLSVVLGEQDLCGKQLEN